MELIQCSTEVLSGLIKQAVTKAVSDLSNSNTQLLTVNEAAEHMSCSSGTIRNWVKEGKLPAHRWGRIVRIKLSDLESILVPTTDLED